MHIKYLATLIFIATFNISSFSQIIKGNDGRYYDENDKLFTGTYLEFYDNGNKKMEVSLKDGIKDGEMILYFEDGKKNEVRYFDKGNMNGIWLKWNKNEIKIGEASYKNGLKHGNWKIWDDEGNLRFSMQYQEGNKNGVWTMWDEKGNVISEKEY